MAYLRSVLVFLLACVALVFTSEEVDVTERFLSLKNKTQGRAHPTIHSLLHLPSSIGLDETETIATVHGVTRARFRETYNGLRVIGSSIEANVDSNNNYDGGMISGVLYLNIENDLPDKKSCTLTKLEAKHKVLTEEGLGLNSKIVKETIEERVYIDDIKKAHYAYSVDLYIHKSHGYTRPYYIIDMCNGEILEYFQKLSTKSILTERDLKKRNPFEAAVDETLVTDGETSPTTSPKTTPKTSPTTPKTSPTTPKTLPTTPKTLPTTPPPTAQPGLKCSNKVKGIGGNPKLGPIDYSVAPNCLDVRIDGETCYLENSFVKTVDLKQTEDEDKTQVVSFKCAEGYNDAINGATNPVFDAHFFGTSAFKMFRDWYKETPLKSVAYLLVHYGKDEDNAYWTGSKMLFGDGGEETYPLVALDVICHELGHGYTQRYSDLIYKEQSGGINEAFSDMAGEAVEAYYKENDWMTGYTLSKAKGEALRYMFNPPKDGASIKMASDFKAGMDVHYSSGVYNFVFYHIVEKGKIPIKYAFEGFLLANKIYWKENTDFTGGACGSLRGAYHAGLDTEKFVQAFQAVGLVPCSSTKYLEMLVPLAPRSKVRASAIRHPVFGVKTLADTTKLIVKASSASGAPVKVALSSTMSRLNPLATGTGTAEISVSGGALYYARIYTDSNVEISDVTVSATFQ